MIYEVVQLKVEFVLFCGKKRMKNKFKFNVIAKSHTTSDASAQVLSDSYRCKYSVAYCDLDIILKYMCVNKWI